jgi:hypothetical protein
MKALYNDKGHVITIIRPASKTNQAINSLMCSLGLHLRFVFMRGDDPALGLTSPESFEYY